MADPFFDKNRYKNESNTGNNQNEYQHIIDQQKEIEENFSKLKSLFSEPGLSEEQKIQIKNKLLDLKGIYANNKKLLVERGIDQNMQEQLNSAQQTVHINKINPVNTAGGRKIHINNILIGCGVLFLLLLGGIAFLFYYMITHPAQLKNVGLEPGNVKKLLQTFTAVFFGLIVIVGFVFLIMNLYRIFASKKKSKISYIMGMFLGFFLLGGGLVGGYTVMEKVNTISIDAILNNNNLVRPYILIKDKKEYLGERNGPIIGPSQFVFGLNSDLLNQQILPKINGKINSIKFLCGNGQELTKNTTNDIFNGICFYRVPNSSGYPLQVHIGYIDAQTSEQLFKSFDVGNFNISSAVSITNEKGKVLNPGNQPQILGGIAGDTLTFDASEVFKNLGLNKYEIIWDLNGDGVPDRENESKVSYRYTTAGVYHVSFRIAALGDFLYGFPIRIEQSDIPVGDLEYRDLGNRNYSFSVNFLDKTKTVTKYLFQVLNSDNSLLYRNEKTNNNFSYSFDRPGEYRVKVIFLTQDNKQGELITKPIIINDKNNQLDFSVESKLFNETIFQTIPLEGSKDNPSIKLQDIPAKVKITIDKNSIDTDGYLLSAKENNNPLVFSDDTLVIDINSDEKHTVTIVAKDTETQQTIQKTLTITVNREGVIGNLLITPDTVGTSPFTVKFDASTSRVNDIEDEIVYFTWDFGDGEVKKNISQAIIEHTYYYDIKENNGEYHPNLIVKTRKGKEYHIGENTMILVKQPIETLNIILESHPSQIANAGDSIKMGLDIDGLPTKIKWDFGDNSTGIECKGRECVNITKIYQTPGEYKIKVQVEYENRIPLEGDITLLVK